MAPTAKQDTPKRHMDPNGKVHDYLLWIIFKTVVCIGMFLPTYEKVSVGNWLIIHNVI